MEHFLSGFMKDSLGHLKASPNSGEFLSVARTLRLLGGCVLVIILCASYSALLSLHHTWA